MSMHRYAAVLRGIRLHALPFRDAQDLKNATHARDSRQVRLNHLIQKSTSLFVHQAAMQEDHEKASSARLVSGCQARNEAKGKAAPTHLKSQ
eukprot:311159-Pelagomonas_calceolata.AAC.7